MLDRLDVVVVGGGPAGASASLMLARAGFAVGLYERTRYDEPRVGETLSPAAVHALRRLGLWECIAALGPLPSFGNKSAWGPAELAASPFLFNPYGSGLHVVRDRFDAALADSARAAGVAVELDGRVVSCAEEAPGGWRLETLASDGRRRSVTARALVDAGGRGSWIGRGLGGHRRLYDRLVGIAVRYRSEVHDGGHTLVETAPGGWWYSAPVPPDRLMAMFMTDADLCRRGRFRDAHVWEAALEQTEHTRMRIAGCARLWRPTIRAAMTQRFERRHEGARWLAAGDAALAVDPLSSSGILRALRTGEAAADALGGWIRSERDPTSLYEGWLDAQLGEYLRERAAYYALETRWRREPFWGRRHQVSGAEDVVSVGIGAVPSEPARPVDSARGCEAESASHA